LLIRYSKLSQERERQTEAERKEEGKEKEKGRETTFTCLLTAYIIYY
jgi:hypothetical protein